MGDKRVYSVDNGDRGTVYCDGEEVASCVACCPDEGWATKHVLDGNGQPVADEDDFLQFENVRGKIEFVPKEGG